MPAGLVTGFEPIQETFACVHLHRSKIESTLSRAQKIAYLLVREIEATPSDMPARRDLLRIAAEINDVANEIIKNALQQYQEERSSGHSECIDPCTRD